MKRARTSEVWTRTSGQDKTSARTSEIKNKKNIKIIYINNVNTTYKSL